MLLGRIEITLSARFQRKLTKVANIMTLLRKKNLLIHRTVENTEPVSEKLSDGLISVENTELSLQKMPKETKMIEMIEISMLQYELQNFVSGSADVQGAILASPNGVALASVLPKGMDEERTAAISASMLSLSERIGHELARGSVDRIVVEGEKGYGILVGCGHEAVLLVLASGVVKQGILFVEIKQAVSRISPMLA